MIKVHCCLGCYIPFWSHNAKCGWLCAIDIYFEEVWLFDGVYVVGVSAVVLSVCQTASNN